MSACGQQEQAAAPDSTAAATERTAAPDDEPADEKVEITITAPKADAEVGQTTTVTGRATPGTTVLLSGGCAECQAIARADGKGEWETELRLAPPEATIEASTASAPVRDTVTVAVRAPEPQKAPRPRREQVEDFEPPPDVPVPEPVTPLATLPPVRGLRVVVVGDSLAVGMKGLLGPLLPGGEVAFDARTSRPLADGMAIIEQTDLTTVPTVLAVSLFTNDSPTEVDTLEAAVRETVERVGPSGCAVWATIVRPPLNGVSYEAANRKLAALSQKLPNLRVVDWAGRVAAEPALLAGDGVHGTSLGYQARAALYAEAIRSC